jgi:predicted ABC-type ATPase
MGVSFVAKQKSKPRVMVIAGPNGAGKSTAALSILEAAGVDEFVNADTIARGLSAIEPERVAIEAGRIMLKRLRELARKRVSFAFETTLASQTFAPWLGALQEDGYRTSLTFLSLPGPELAVERVRTRIASGGHAVPDDVICRRFVRGIRNLMSLYILVVDDWVVYDNTRPREPLILAYSFQKRVIVMDEHRWNNLKKWEVQ